MFFEPRTIDFDINLNKHFEAPPYSQAVEVGGSVELRCHPPLGVPPPTVYWLKNSAPLETDTNLIVSREGHLLVGQARLEDTANYTCVAENVAAHRLSEAARLIVYVNGGWSPWSAWSECSPSCGHGMKKRSRLCINPAPFDGGLTCQGPSVQRSDCTSECPALCGSISWSTLYSVAWQMHELNEVSKIQARIHIFLFDIIRC
uniref:Ig-like domain-containing protein n=1 Tax=Timema monikensis TaxID=170555 RepID=A0A7R9EI08_9NEOP|nr:unnamed protein product [Timema monikensis]